MRPLLIYIHGFKSSSQSAKAEETRQYLLDHKLEIDFIAPDLANYPGEAHQQLQRLIEQQPTRKIALLGSSLGGFMATTLAEQYGLRAVLVNPVVYPYKLIRYLLGENINPYSGETFMLDETHLQELHIIEVDTLSQPLQLQLQVLLQTGDETLDYSEAVDYYQGCHQIVEEGGSHRFEDFENHLPELIKFLKLA